MKIERRRFIRHATAGTYATALALGEQTAPRRNVLFIVADQHQAACMHHEGHPQAITPNLDRLAARGVRFTHAYTQNPICTPSRISMLTGQYPHNHGYYGLAGPPLQKHLPSFLQHCQRAGYRTAAIGKIHTPENWLEPHCDLFNEYRDYMAYLTRLGLREKEDSIGLPEFPGKQQHEGRPSNLKYRDSVEGWAVTQAVHFIDSCQDQPFCMQVSLPKPHECYTPAKEFWEMYPDDLALPRTLYNSAVGRPPHFQRMVERLKKMEWLIEPKTFEAGCRRVWHGYLACITHTDYAVGELLNHLEKTGKAANTIVVYTADHGGYAGTYGVPEKAPGICSDAVCRVPSIWYVPELSKSGHVSSHLIESIDIAPTVASLCGLPAMQTVDGHDITGLLRGEDQRVREVAVTENPWSKALRWGPWRFVHYQPEMFGQDIGELYNIEQDPDETRNLYREKDAEPIVHQSRRLLLEWMIRSSRYRTAFPPTPGLNPDELYAEDGSESNRAGIAGHARRGGQNYI